LVGEYEFGSVVAAKDRSRDKHNQSHSPKFKFIFTFITNMHFLQRKTICFWRRKPKWTGPICGGLLIQSFYQ